MHIIVFIMFLDRSSHSSSKKITSSNFNCPDETSILSYISNYKSCLCNKTKRSSLILLQKSSFQKGEIKGRCKWNSNSAQNNILKLDLTLSPKSEYGCVCVCIYVCVCKFVCVFVCFGGRACTAVNIESGLEIYSFNVETWHFLGML